MYSEIFFVLLFSNDIFFLQERQDLQRIEKDHIAGKRPTVCVRVHGSARVCPHMHAHGSARVCPCMHAHVHAIVGLSASACAGGGGRNTWTAVMPQSLFPCLITVTFCYF